MLTILALLLTAAASADSIQSRIYEIELSEREGEPHLIKFESGRVALLDPEDHGSLLALQRGLKSGSLVTVETGPQHGVVAMGEYRPSIVSDPKLLPGIFKRMRRGWQKESQCYNRAHIWAYEEFRRTSLKSMKLFLFFTSRYIRNYNYGWWFHVAPLALVNRGGKGHPQVLDPRFTNGPMDISQWTSIFIESRRTCPLVKRYSQYRNYQAYEDCYLIPASMYYWQPRDLETFEKTGREKTSFISKEVGWALTEAF